MLHGKSRGTAFLFDWRYQSWLGATGFAVAVGVAYFMAAWLGLALRADTGTSIFWPAAGIAVGAVIVWGPGRRLPVAAGVFVATAAANLMMGRNGWLAVAFGVVNVGQALLATTLIERWFGRLFKLGDVREVLGFLLASAIGSAIGALGATIAVSLIQSTASPFIVWRVWFASCLLGIVTVAPLLVGASEAVRQIPPRRELIEGAVGVLVLAVSSAFSISLPQGAWSTALRVAVVFPTLLWIAARCRLVFAAAAAFVVALAVIWSIAFSVGHFGDASIPLADRKLAAQTVVLAGTLLTLVLTALFAERRHSEGVLKQSERRLRLALDGAELGAFSADLTTGRFECDARAALIHGHNAQPTTIREAMRFVHPQDRIRLDAALAEALHTGGIWNAEYRVRHPAGHLHAGETRWVAVEGSIVHDSHRTAAGLLGVTRDITERRRTEQSLVERDLQLAMAGKAALVGSFAFDVGSEKIQTSEGYAAIHGFPDGTTEIERSEWRAGVHPEDLGGVEELRSRAFRDRRKEYSAEYRIVRPGGEVRWIESRYFVSYHSNGRPRRVIGVNIDATARKKAEQIAHRLACIVECSDDAILSKDPNGVIVSWNHGAERLFGYSAEEVIGKSIVMLIPPGRQHEEEGILARIRLGERITHYETVRCRKDGTLVDVSLTVSPLYDTAGAIIGVSKIARDISVRKRADEHQRALNAELDHRVKNVLATVGAIITQTSKSHGSSADFVAAFNERIKSLARTHELLSQSRWHGVSLEEIAQRELAPYGADNAEIGGPRATLKAEAVPAVGMVLHELATNAAKHGALSIPGGRVLLRWRWLRNGSSGRLAIEWQESGGPPVREPSQPGYGTSIVRELIPFELGGTAEMDFDFNGLYCRLEIPPNWVRDVASQSMIHQNLVSAQTSPLSLMGKHKAS